jgi:hypothetical protein
VTVPATPADNLWVTIQPLYLDDVQVFSRSWQPDGTRGPGPAAGRGPPSVCRQGAAHAAVQPAARYLAHRAHRLLRAAAHHQHARDVRQRAYQHQCAGLRRADSSGAGPVPGRGPGAGMDVRRAVCHHPRCPVGAQRAAAKWHGLARGLLCGRIGQIPAAGGPGAWTKPCPRCCAGMCS